MLQDLGDESNNRGLRMNKSKTKMIMENDTSIYVTLKATWDRDTAPETETKTRRFKEQSRPDEQHSPSTATHSRVTLQHA